MLIAFPVMFHQFISVYAAPPGVLEKVSERSGGRELMAKNGNSPLLREWRRLGTENCGWGEKWGPPALSTGGLG
jgi:hypothetical protein